MTTPYDPDFDYGQLAAGAPKLRAEFPASQIGKLPKAGMDLDYVGHGAVTSRLLEVDPAWWWEPMGYEPTGLPVFDYNADGVKVGLWIKLHVCGMWRIGYGSCLARQFDPEKVLIGDAIRNAAMRFGVALDLWVRGHDPEDQPGRHQSDQPRPQRPVEPEIQKETLDLLDLMMEKIASDESVKVAASEVWVKKFQKQPRRTFTQKQGLDAVKLMQPYMDELPAQIEIEEEGDGDAD